MKVLIGLGITLAVVLVVALSCGAYAVGTRNGLVDKEVAVENAWGDVEVQYQRRADLIPQLVATVSGIAAQERVVFETVTELRASVGQMRVNPNDPNSPFKQVDLNNPDEVATFMSLQNQMTSALSRLLLVVENYPEIRSQENFLELQAQIEGTENRIAVARRDYNGTVADYKRAIKHFPSNVVASLFGFEDRFSYFEADEGADQAPKIDFGIPEKK